MTCPAKTCLSEIDLCDRKNLPKTLAFHKNVILDGGPSMDKSPLIPHWDKTLTSEQVDGLVKHLRKLCQCKGKQG